jgi:WD40 repeat protein
MRSIRYFVVLALTLGIASTSLAQTPQVIWSKRNSHSAINAVQFSPDGRYIATASDDGKVRLWDVSSGRTFGVVADHFDAALSLAFSPNGAFLATGGADDSIHLIRVSDQTTLYTIADTGFIEGLSFSPDGNTLGAALGYFSRELHQFRVSDGQLMSITHHHWGTVWSVDYSRDGSHVVTAGADGRILLYGVPMWNPTDLAGHEGDAIAAKFSPNSMYVASAGEYEAKLKLHSVATGGLLYSIDVGAIMHSISFAPDSNLIGIAGQVWPDQTGKIAFYRVSDGSLAFGFSNVGHGVNGISVSPDNLTFAYGRDDGTLVLAKLAPGLTSRRR